MPKRYGIHSIFGPTIQGEGGMVGVPCMFVRFSGCNMWDGRPESRSASICPFCDTDFLAHTMMTTDEIIGMLNPLSMQWVTLSGGEPMLQVDDGLVDALHTAGFKVAVETNGTIDIPQQLHEQIDHVTCSPKIPDISLRRANTLKLLYPHPNTLLTPEAFTTFNADEFYLQPIDTETKKGNRENLQATINKLYTLSGWRLSLQIHKIIGVE
jgi:7-carboxy-7-deazaguanine synthase